MCSQSRVWYDRSTPVYVHVPPPLPPPLSRRTKRSRSPPPPPPPPKRNYVPQSVPCDYASVAESLSLELATCIDHLTESQHQWPQCPKMPKTRPGELFPDETEFMHYLCDMIDCAIECTRIRKLEEACKI